VTLLKDKNAIVYGGGGLIGGAIAEAFAREGANVFLAARSTASLEAVAQRITMAGGSAETAQVDAMDESAVSEHAASVADRAGTIDVSVNAVGIHGELQGTPLLEITPDDYAAPIRKGTTTNFLTARTAARHMTERRSGTILMISATATWSKAALNHPIPMGGFGAACAAIEGLSRSLAAEVGPHGVRVACLRLEGTAELFAALTASGARIGTIPASQMETLLEGDSLLRRLPTISEVGNAAALLASGRAAAMTGVVANISCGAVVT
jgi:3-oxoacyl-[acyl-carrier protein] reductase